MWGVIRKLAGEGHFCHHAHRPKVFVLFSCISFWEDLGSGGKQGPVEANRSYLNHQFSPVCLAVYLRFVGHLDQCFFCTRWWLWNPGHNREWRMPRMEGCVWKKVDYSVVVLQSKLTKQRGEDKKVNAKSFYFTSLARKSHHLAPVVQTLDSVIHRINHYPADSVIDFRNTYRLDSDLSGG